MIDRHDPLRRQALESPSELYHEASALRDSDTALGRAVWSVNTSAAIKRIIASPATSLKGYRSIALPLENPLPPRGLAETLLGRRSTRRFDRQPLTLSEISAVLYYSAAVTSSSVDGDGITWGFRCAPSGGALYPIDLYCAVQHVTGLEEGLYTYVPQPHSLQVLSARPVREALGAATFLNETVSAAGATLLMVANFPRTKFKYGERGYRFALLEAGHIAQNMLLVAESLTLGALALGGFVDDRLNALVEADGCDRAVVYAILVGRRTAAEARDSARD